MLMIMMNGSWSFNPEEVISLALTVAPFIAGTIFLWLEYREHRKRSRLLRIMDRYSLVLTPLNNFMLSASRYISIPVKVIEQFMNQAVKSGHSSDAGFKKIIEPYGMLKVLANQAETDNESSVTRTTPIATASPGNPGSPKKIARTILLLILILALYSSAKILNVLDAFTSYSLLISAIGLVYVFIASRQFNITKSSRMITERQAAMSVQSFLVRREYILSVSDQYTNLISEMQKNSAQLISMPESKNLFKAISWINTLCNRIESAHQASNLTVDAPLLSVTAYLRNVYSKDYLALSRAYQSELDMTLEEGLAFRINPSDLNQLMKSLLENALSHSKDTVRITGRRRMGRSIIQIADKGAGIPDEILTSSKKAVATESKTIAQPEAPSLSLLINNIIMARVGGKLKISSMPGKGTTITITAPKSSTREDLRIPTRILKSNHSIDSRTNDYA